MTVLPTSITLRPGPPDALQRVATVLSKLKSDDYYAYERTGVWYLGIGNRSSVTIDLEGRKATFSTNGKDEVRSIDGGVTDVVREYTSANEDCGTRIYGYPMLSLMVPRTEVVFYPDRITLTGVDKRGTVELSALVDDTTCIEPSPGHPIDTNTRASEYVEQVEAALADIRAEKYTKVIPSRAVSLPWRVDMPGTLLCGRQHNNPARSFCLRHGNNQATGFSPELVMSLRDGGGRDKSKKLKEALVSDPKEIVEHVLSVKEAINELDRLCSPGTVVVDDLMTVRPRGSVQHLGSTVSGALLPGKDAWDTFNILFPSITATGIPKQAALEGIGRLEKHPRELYSGAILLIEDPETWDVALVLRTVFQGREKQWIQAGAGIVAQSSPGRELTETSEKLASIAPYVFAERNQKD
ncbi:ADC synthase [Aspergillus flavus]|uniref:Salicylate synthase n=2 Tax=Aspergillus subgen. Circumdati TaxID=2720871 RepID=A0A1S9E1R6_ASPOZ|nr:ADC synthase [Aspergillus flavus]KAJ1705180.1 ADC synthase [Aspergillus flavus]OOO15116.1 salicylate synthase [Aspergillus oryzae]